MTQFPTSPSFPPAASAGAAPGAGGATAGGWEDLTARPSFGADAVPSCSHLGDPAPRPAPAPSHRAESSAAGEPAAGVTAPARVPQERRLFTDPYPQQRGSLVDRLTGAARRARIMRTEGPRGMATRASVWLRYLAYALSIVACSALTHAFLAESATTRMGGKFMLFSATTIAVTAAAGCVAFPLQRTKLIEEMRHYLFGLCVFPATGIAAIIWAMRSMVSAPTAGGDTMLQLLSFSVPVVFACTLIIPPALFVKLVAGAQTLTRSTMDDAELIAMYTRQDGFLH